MDEHLAGMALNTMIRRNIDIAASASKKQTVFEFAPNSNGSKDYNTLTDEILLKEGL